jgi:hypothetical protein
MVIPRSSLGHLASTTPDPKALTNLQILLWTGVVVLVLFFGLILMLTVLRIVRRRYFKAAATPVAVPDSPWKAAGQRVAPVEGGTELEGQTPDDDPDSYRHGRNQDHDPNEDTGPFPDEDPDDDPDDDDGDAWKRI